MGQEKFEQTIHLGDNVLILGQRMSEWCGHAPALEEDLAIANIALDLIGQARMLLQYAGHFDEKKRDEDQLAFLRTESAFRNFTLCELPNHDFARTMVRMFLFSAWQIEAWQALSKSDDAQLKAIAQKAMKETQYHLNHCGEWVIRLGDGTDVSHVKAQEALNYVWPFLNELFAQDSAQAQSFMQLVQPVLTEAGLNPPKATPFKSYGKLGRHSEHMGHLLAQMQYLQRTYPGATW